MGSSVSCNVIQHISLFILIMIIKTKQTGKPNPLKFTNKKCSAFDTLSSSDFVMTCLRKNIHEFK